MTNYMSLNKLCLGVAALCALSLPASSEENKKFVLQDYFAQAARVSSATVPARAGQEEPGHFKYSLKNDPDKKFNMDLHTYDFVASERYLVGSKMFIMQSRKGKDEAYFDEFEKELREALGYSILIESKINDADMDLRGYVLTKQNYFFLKKPFQRVLYDYTQNIPALTDIDKRSIEDFVTNPKYERGDVLEIYKKGIEYDDKAKGLKKTLSLSPDFIKEVKGKEAIYDCIINECSYGETDCRTKYRIIRR